MSFRRKAGNWIVLCGAFQIGQEFSNQADAQAFKNQLDAWYKRRTQPEDCCCKGIHEVKFVEK